jgi:enamine deaminase RidA (YjgF/YER057c/UK114 family)
VSVRYIRQPEGLGEPLGRYSHLSISSGRLVIVAGQVGVTADGQMAEGGFSGEIRQTYRNFGQALAAVGVGFGDVAKMNTYIVGAHNIPEFMQIRGEVFADLYPTADYPPNTLVVVSRLVEERFLIEIEGLATLDRD